MTRVVIVGAGAIGGAVAARLAEADVDVTVVARGAHAAAIASDGLVLAEPTRTVTISVPVALSVGEAAIDASTRRRSWRSRSRARTLRRCSTSWCAARRQRRRWRVSRTA